MPQTFWDKKKANYVTGKGKPIPYEKVRAGVEAVSADTATKLRSLTQSFIDGKKTLPAWATESEKLIKNAILSSGQVGAGGRQQLTNSLNGRLGSIVKFHLNKFREMGLARERGEVTDAALLARAEMYGSSSVSAYESIRLAVMKDAGYSEGMRILGASEHCADCPPLAGKWTKIDDLRPIGTTACLTRCRCSIEYR